jgi:hypothetical protein
MIVKKQIAKLLIAVLLCTTLQVFGQTKTIRAEPLEIIVDNGNNYNQVNLSGTFAKSPGTWSGNTINSAAFESNYFTSNDPATYGVWKPIIPISGEYEIYMTWVSHSNRSAAAPLEIKHKNGTDASKTVNQKINGSQVGSRVWNYIGAYELQAGEDQHVKLSNIAGGDYVFYDAVKLVLKHASEDPEPDPTPPGTVLDNTYSPFSTTGSWIRKTATAAVYGSDYMVTSGTAGNPENTAKWSIPDDMPAGEYDLYMRWEAGEDKADAAPLEIKFDLGLATSKTVNQQQLGGRWNLIGTYYFTPGHGHYVMISGSDDGVTVADALKLVLKKPTSALPPDPAPPEMPTNVGDEMMIDNTDSRFTVSGSWMSDTAGAGYEGSHYARVTDATPDRSNAAKWSTSKMKTSGKYEIYMKWPAGPERPEAVPLQIKSSDGMEAYSPANSNYSVDSSPFVNQRENGGTWNYIGTYEFKSGDNYFIKMSGEYGGLIAADAVKLVLKEITQDPIPYPNPRYSGPIKVEIVHDENGSFSLRRNGQPYFLKGVAGSENVELTAAMGGNALRTYNHEDSLNGWDILDRAYENGVGVMIGLFLLQQDAGIDYSNPAYKNKIAEQLNKFKQAVMQYKDHPAVIAWAIGNETDKGNADVWYHVNELGKFIHDNDPNHPTVAVLAGSSPAKVKNVKAIAPHIDILAVNTYTHIGNAYQNVVVEGGWNGPYMITEFGPDATYEVKNVNGLAPIELNSDQKAKLIYERYQNHIAGHPDKAVGSFVFKIADIVGTTHTWYNLLLEDHKKTPLFDEISRAWTGTYPVNRSPAVKELTFSGGAYGNLALDPSVAAEVQLNPGDPFLMKAVALDPEADPLSYVWEIRDEFKADYTSKPSRQIPDIIYDVQAGEPNKMGFYAPMRSGHYRVFLSVYDGNHNVGTANFPFQVK